MVGSYGNGDSYGDGGGGGVLLLVVVADGLSCSVGASKYLSVSEILFSMI